MRLATPVDVSLWTTATALIARAAIGAQGVLERVEIDAVAPVAGHEVDVEPQPLRHVAATASRSDRSRTSAPDRRATAC